MGGAVNWRFIQDGDDWMRQQEKRVLHQERRPRVTNASDLMGPGLGPHAVQISDWSSEETTFNGMFYSEPGAANTPDPALVWLGMVIASKSGHGLQQIWGHVMGGGAPPHYIRSFHSHSFDMRIFSAWTLL